MRQTYARVDLARLQDNVRILRGALPPGTKFMAVVKADAYGHGMVPVARAAAAAGADAFAVALAEEGAALREEGIGEPILVLSGLGPTSAEEAVSHGLTLTVYTPEQVRDAQAACGRAGTTAHVHLKLDSGMNRIGARNEGEAADVLDALAHAPRLRLEGAYTHFACADEDDQAITDSQLERFTRLKEMLPAGLTLHASGSAGVLRRADAHFGLVRSGIAMYGYPPVDTALSLLPVLSWHAEVSHVKTVLPGEFVSYGATWAADRPTRVATVSVGYGDGFSRALSNRGVLLIGGMRCPVLGRVCMDMVMADVTHAGPVRPGDDAVLIGEQGGERVTAQDMARMLSTISYEVLLGISPRVPRVYA
ncbi:MAG TPA: alanine racemase [Candidatus Limnocylindria bacterium]|nr:alanine racemase [Candidatus Limnocylindria bacterium]